MLHAIFADKQIKQFNGSFSEADAEVERQRGIGHIACYLFSANTEDEYQRQLEKERTGKVEVWPTI